MVEADQIDRKAKARQSWIRGARGTAVMLYCNINQHRTISRHYRLPHELTVPGNDPSFRQSTVQYMSQTSHNKAIAPWHTLHRGHRAICNMQGRDNLPHRCPGEGCMAGTLVCERGYKSLTLHRAPLLTFQQCTLLKSLPCFCVVIVWQAVG